MRDYMQENEIERIFYGDGDSAVFVNITSINDLRPSCDSVINYERQTRFHWVAAAESSFWNLPALIDFCR
jgi:hypothetical protein